MKRTILLPVFACLLVSASSLAEDERISFQTFWGHFRDAVVNNDRERVAGLTRFPFETQGVSDDDPVQLHGRRAFLALFDDLVGTAVYIVEHDHLVTKPMIDIIGERVEIDESHLLTEDIARVEDFEFGRVDGHWRFTRAYTDEP
jgi:hypothetical protein